MAVSVFPTPSGSSVPNWTLLQTATPSGVLTATFSGLSGYSRYRVIMNITTSTGTGQSLYLIINGDTTITNYPGGFSNATSATAFANGNGFGNQSSTSASTKQVSEWEIDNALLATHKKVVWSAPISNNGSGIGALLNGNGLYLGSSVISSLAVNAIGGTQTMTGSVYLLGAN